MSPPTPLPTYVEDKNKRFVSFSKRRSTLLSNLHSLHTVDNCHCLMVLATESGNITLYGSPSFQPLTESSTFHSLICKAIAKPIDDESS
ncbi:hypothetical protein GEMRC1_011353 [Eukaryota sp. GEM-RC1]